VSRLLPLLLHVSILLGVSSIQAAGESLRFHPSPEGRDRYWGVSAKRTYLLAPDGFSMHAGTARAARSGVWGGAASDGPAAHSIEKIGLRWLGANLQATPHGSDPDGGQVHYLLGGDQGTARVNTTYARVRYADVYPGVAIDYYGVPQGLEYDFVVAPGADPAQIRFIEQDGRRLRIGANGDLLLASGANWRQARPVAYQMRGDAREPVAAAYRQLESGAFGMRVGDYDRSRELIIDPVVFSRQIPGDRDDRFLAVALDDDGFIYAAGYAATRTMPVVGGFQTEKGSSILNDGYIARFSPDGVDIVSSTYIGGDGTDNIMGIAVDRDGFIYVVGWTDSANFPTTPDAMQRTLAGDRDMFIAKLQPDASALVYSTYLGTAERDVAERIRVDAEGNVYVVGSTFGATFPTTPGVAQPTFGGGDSDAVIFKLNDRGDGFLWSTFYGGSGDELAQDLEVDVNGRAVLACETSSEDLPVTSDAVQSANGGEVDACAAAFGRAGELLYGTYLGGERFDRPFGMTLGEFDTILLTGGTNSPDFPIGDSGEQPLEVQGAVDGFLAVLPAPDAFAPGDSAAAAGVAQTVPGGLGPPSQLRTFFDPGSGFNAGRDVDQLIESNAGSLIGYGVSFEEDGPGARIDSRLEVFTLGELYGTASAASLRKEQGAGRRSVRQQGSSVRDSASRRTRTRHNEESCGSIASVGIAEDDTGSGDGILGLSKVQAGLSVSKRLSGGSRGRVGPAFDPRSYDKVAQGTRVFFEIVVTNTGFAPLSGVTLEDVLPDGWSFPGGPGGAPTASLGVIDCGDPSFGRLTCAVGDSSPGVLQPQSRVVLRVPARPDRSFGSDVIVRNRAVATANEVEGEAMDSALVAILPSDRLPVPLPPDPLIRLDLGVSLESESAVSELSEEGASQIGRTTRILIAVRNPNDASAAQLRLESKLSPMLTNPRIVTPQQECRIRVGPVFNGLGVDTVVCQRASLNGGDRWDVIIETDVRPGRLRITAGAKLRATNLEGEPLLASDVKIFGGEPAADLRSLVNLDGPARETAIGGCSVCQAARLTVANYGLSDAPDTTARVRRAVPGATFANAGPMCSAAAEELHCEFGELPAEEVVSSAFEVCIPCERTDFGAVLLTASAESSLPDPNVRNNGHRLVYRPSAADGGQAVVINGGGVIDTAKFGGRWLVPGSDPSLFGSGLADELAVATSLPLPTTLAGVSVEVNGFPAPLIFVSPNQINFQTPWEIADQDWVDVVVRKNGQASDPERVFVAPFDPGLFSLSQTGSGQGAILIAGTAAVPAPEGAVPGGRPAAVGEFLSLFAIGLGPVINQPDSGAVAPINPFATTKAQPRVTIGGVEAPVVFSGLAPGLAGVYQVNVQIAQGTPSGGAVDVQLTTGGISSNVVTIAIRPQ